MKQISGNVFIDTNILIYLYSDDEPNKRRSVDSLFDAHKIIISTQVINEFVNVMYKKKKTPLDVLHLAIGELSKNSQIAIVNTSTIEKAMSIANTINTHTMIA